MMQGQGFVDPGQRGNNQNGMWSPSRAEVGEAGIPQRTDVPLPPSTPSSGRSRRGQQQQHPQQQQWNVGGANVSQGWSVKITNMISCVLLLEKRPRSQTPKPLMPQAARYSF